MTMGNGQFLVPTKSEELLPEKYIEMDDSFRDVLPQPRRN